MRVLIVGAGPTGLTTAVELARQGIIPEIVDRKEAPSTLSRAVGIMPSSLERLAPSGVTERLLDEGVRMGELRIFQGSRPALTVPLTGAQPKHDYVLALAQDRTEAALRDALAELGVKVRYGVEVLSFRQDKANVFVETSCQKEHYDYVVGADGAHSQVRQALGVDYAGFDLPKTWSIADVDATDWPHAQAFVLCILPSGSVAVVVPLEAKRFRIVSNTRSALETMPLEMNVHNIRRESTFQISVRQVAEYRVGRTFLAGDAAHCHSPAGGRGMNLGIADAVELASCFVENRLDQYSKARHSAGAKTIAVSERMRRFVTSTNPAVQIARWLTFKAAPLAKRIIARQFLNG